MIAVLVGLCIMVDWSILYLDGLGRYGIRIDLTMKAMLIGSAVTLAYTVSAGLPRMRYVTMTAFVVYLMATWSIVKQVNLHDMQLVVFGLTKMGEAWFVASVAAMSMQILHERAEPTPVSSREPLGPE